MSKKYSIIIPTYNKCGIALRPCLESIIKFTDLSTTEVIVVANGCTDETKDYVTGLITKYPDSFRLLWSDAPLGYTKAVNPGIRQAEGEFVILLNNDTVLLDQPYHEWVKILERPFLDDPKMGITGPMQAYSPSAGAEFLIFFCVMIRKSLFDVIGILDEYYAPGYGEDTDFCLKAVEAGWKFQQVPERSSLFSDDAHKRMIGNFPIYHEGNVTFRDYDDNDKHLLMNNEILADRWNKPAINIQKAQAVEGFMSDLELEWLAIQATKYDTIIEVGSWLGRSTRALCDNAKYSATVYAVDTWNGSLGEQDTFHAAAKWAEGDWAMYTFLMNNYDHAASGKLIPLRLNSRIGAALLKNKGVKADFVFLDAGHTKEELAADIRYWMPLMKDGGIICGHDYYFDGAWPGVREAVNELSGFKVVPNTSIWWKMIGKNDLRPRVYDCFPFFNELDLLDIRFAELDSVVDRWVITECTKTHSGQDKPLYFKDNLDRYAKYLHKITHIVVDDLPPVPENEADRSWAIERHQRDAIMRGLTSCKDNDIILIGDADEIPKASAIQKYLDMPEKNLSCISLRPCYYYMNCESDIPWNWLRILPYSIMKDMTPCGVRYVPNYDLVNGVITGTDSGSRLSIEYAGWHYSFLGGIDKWIEKIENTAHQEYNKPEFKNPDTIRQLVEQGKDILFRDIKYNFKPAVPSDYYPNYVNENWDRFIKNEFIHITSRVNPGIRVEVSEGNAPAAAERPNIIIINP